jgi:hypothetical protein
MPSAKALARFERVIWILIYGGLFALVLGLAARGRSPAASWTLIVSGSCISAVGALLIWVRSRMSETR